MNLDVVKVQDLLYSLITVYKFSADKNICWDFFENNWQKLSFKFKQTLLMFKFCRFPMESLNDFILSIVTITNDKSLLMRVKSKLSFNKIRYNCS